MSHFCTNHFVHRNLTKYFSKKLKFFRVAHSKLGAKALSFSSSPHRTGKRWEDIFFSCSQKWTRKNPETVAASGFSGAISFLVAQCGCGDRTRTCDLRVMSPTSYQLLYSAISTFVVPVTGLEPVQYRYRGILSPLCLPIPPHRQLSATIRIPYSRGYVKRLTPKKKEKIYDLQKKVALFRAISRRWAHILIKDRFAKEENTYESPVCRQ